MPRRYWPLLPCAGSAVGAATPTALPAATAAVAATTIHATSTKPTTESLASASAESAGSASRGPEAPAAAAIAATNASSAATNAAATLATATAQSAATLSASTANAAAVAKLATSANGMSGCAGRLRCLLPVRVLPDHALASLHGQPGHLPACRVPGQQFLLQLDEPNVELLRLAAASRLPTGSAASCAAVTRAAADAANAAALAWPATGDTRAELPEGRHLCRRGRGHGRGVRRRCLQDKPRRHDRRRGAVGHRGHRGVRQRHRHLAHYTEDDNRGGEHSRALPGPGRQHASRPLSIPRRDRRSGRAGQRRRRDGRSVAAAAATVCSYKRRMVLRKLLHAGGRRCWHRLRLARRLLLLHPAMLLLHPDA